MGNIRSFNLNFLPMLREVLRSGSVTKAAAALNVSQPALSAALKQLRQHFNDKLIYRQNGAAILTAKGEMLLEPLEGALSTIESIVLLGKSGIAPEANRIRIAASDYVVLVFGAQLLSGGEPGSSPQRVQFLNYSNHSYQDLGFGAVDLVIGPRDEVEREIASEPGREAFKSTFLTARRMMCIGRFDDNELASGLTPERFLSRPHIGLAIENSRNGNSSSGSLAGRNDVLLTHCYSTMPAIVASTGYLAMIPEDLAVAATKSFPLRAVAPPVAVPSLELAMAWHRRNDDESRHRLLRDELMIAVNKIVADDPGLNNRLVSQGAMGVM